MTACRYAGRSLVGGRKVGGGWGRGLGGATRGQVFFATSEQKALHVGQRVDDTKSGRSVGGLEESSR